MNHKLGRRCQEDHAEQKMAKSGAVCGGTRVAEPGGALSRPCGRAGGARGKQPDSLLIPQLRLPPPGLQYSRFILLSRRPCCEDTRVFRRSAGVERSPALLRARVTARPAASAAALCEGQVRPRPAAAWSPRCAGPAPAGAGAPGGLPAWAAYSRGVCGRFTEATNHLAVAGAGSRWA